MSQTRIAVVLLLAGLGGCSKSEMVPVTGVVMFKGQPAADAEVMFNPKTGRIATGVTDATGRFKLSTAAPDDGAVPGEYMVTLGEYYPPDKPPKMPPPGQGLPMRFPAKYGDPDKTPLTATVERGGKNEFQFDIP